MACKVMHARGGGNPPGLYDLEALGELIYDPVVGRLFLCPECKLGQRVLSGPA